MYYLALVAGLLAAAPQAHHGDDAIPEVISKQAACDVKENDGAKLCEFLKSADEVIGVENISGMGRSPSSYFVLVRYENQWSVHARQIVRGPWRDGVVDWSTLETREIARGIDNRIVSRIKAMLTDRFVAKLNATPFYPGNNICTDGARLSAVIKSPKQDANVSRHSCSPRTTIDDLRDALEAVAFEADPPMAKFTKVRE